MKNRMFVGLVAAATALVLSSSLAAAQEAYSANAIGVIKKTLPVNKMALVSIPLDQDSDEGQGFVFGSVPAIANLPNKTVAYIWDLTNQVWIAQVKDKKSGWGDFEDCLIPPGTPFFLENVATTNIEFIVSGEVPSDASMSKGVVVSNMNLIANPYPVSVAFTNFSFANELPNKSVAYRWDETRQVWVAQVKDKKSGWGDFEEYEVAAGTGLFIEPAGTSGLTWTEVRPYTWPN